MQKDTWAFLAVLTFGTIVAGGVVLGSIAKNERRARDVSTPQIFLEKGHGSAAPIGNRLALTAAHVVLDKARVRYKGQEADVEVVWLDPETDLALIRSSVLPSAGFKVRCSNPDTSEDLAMRGYPFTYGAVQISTRAVGPARDVTRGSSRVPTMLVTPGPMPGMSGGPVVDGEGALAGIIVAVHGMLGMIAPPAELCKVLGRA